MGYYEPGPDSAAGRDEKPAKKIVAILLFQGGLAAVGLLLPSSVGVGQRVRIVLLTVVAQPSTRAPLERACCRCPIRDEAGGGRILLPRAMFSPMAVVWALGGDRARADGRSSGGSGSRAGGHARTHIERSQIATAYPIPSRPSKKPNPYTYLRVPCRHCQRCSDSSGTGSGRSGAAPLPFFATVVYGCCSV